MAIVALPANKKIIIGTVILNAKPSSQLVVKYNAMGIAIIFAMRTNIKNSLFSICMMFNTVAPNTLRMPISFVFTCAV